MKREQKRLPVVLETNTRQRVGYLDVMDLGLDRTGKPIRYFITVKLEPEFENEVTHTMQLEACVLEGGARVLLMPKGAGLEVLRRVGGFVEDAGEL